MDTFTKLRGVAAPLNMINIDTDKLIQNQFLKTIKRTGLARIYLMKCALTKLDQKNRTSC